MEQVPRFDPIAYAKRLGKVVEGWTLKDYLVHAALQNRYETVIIWATQGDMKSSFMLYLLYQVYGDWDKVLRNVVFTPKQVIERFKELGPDYRVTALGWDDIGAHFSPMSFRTDVDVYKAVDEAWQVIRTKASVVVGTIANIDRLPRNIKDNITMEVFMSRPLDPQLADKSYYVVQRWLRLMDFEEPKAYFKKIMIEEGYYSMDSVPSDVFKEYWELRLQLAEEKIRELEETLIEAGEQPNPNERMTAKEAMETRKLGSYELRKLMSLGVLEHIKTPKGVYIKRSSVESHAKHLEIIRRTRGKKRAEAMLKAKR